MATQPPPPPDDATPPECAGDPDLEPVTDEQLVEELEPFLARKARGNRTGPRTKPADDAADAARQLRRKRCVRMRARGCSWQQIADKLGYCSKGHAHNDFHRAVAEWPVESVEEWRHIANEVLFTVLRGHLGPARRGDHDSAGVVIRAVAEHAKINGYRAPEKHEHTGKDGGPIEIDGAHDDLLGRINRLAAAAGAGADRSEPESN